MAFVGNPDESNQNDYRKKRHWLLLALLLAAVGASGFSITYFDVFKLHEVRAPSAVDDRQAVSFIAVPPITVPIGGKGEKHVLLAFSVEVARGDDPSVHHYLPKIIDTATVFLAGIAPEAYARRGIMEILRDELKNRFNMVLEEDLVRNVLLTEFAFR